MIHISKTKKGLFIVVTVANNGAVTNTTETLSSKAKCYKNIRATMKQWEADLVNVQDDTTTEPGVWAISHTSREYLPDMKAEPRYIPGKNPKRKK